MAALADLTLLAIVAASLLVALAMRPKPDRTVAALFIAIAVATYYPNEGGILRYTVARLDVRDLSLFAVFALAVWEMVSGRKPRAVAWGVPALAFYAATLLSLGVAWIDGEIALVRALRDLRPLIFMSLAVLVPLIASTRERLSALVHCLAAYSIIVLALVPLQTLLATESIVLIPGGFLSTAELGPDLVFVGGWSWASLSVGNAFVFVGLYRVLSGHPLVGGVWTTRALVTAGAGLMLVGFGRMNFVSLGVATALALLAVPFQLKMKVLRALAGITAGVAAIAVLLATLLGPKAFDRMEWRVQGLLTVLDPVEYQSTLETGERTSIGRRVMENEVAWDVFTRHPFLGAGPGYSYWRNVELFTPSGERVSLRNITVRGGAYIHNAWLWILSKMGLLGVSAFAWFLVTPFVVGVRRAVSLTRPQDQAVTFGLSFRALALLVDALAHPYFFTVATASGLGLMAGVVLATFERAKDQSDAAQSLDHHSVLQRSAWHSAPLRPA